MHFLKFECLRVAGGGGSKFGFDPLWIKSSSAASLVLFVS